jgi:hypothetical protein
MRSVPVFHDYRLSMLVQNGLSVFVFHGGRFRMSTLYVRGFPMDALHAYRLGVGTVPVVLGQWFRPGAFSTGNTHARHFCRRRGTT